MNVFFSDGVPLNPNIFALKAHYTEKVNQFQNELKSLNENISYVEKVNAELET